LATVDPRGVVNQLLLIDEPENGLHADAQHALRSALEEIAKSYQIQVVYATHSGAMINSLRPDTVRVIRRAKGQDRAVSTIAPAGLDFATVRAQLGMSLSDSLLLAPVSIVVEGRTERACLVPLIQKLARARIEGFEDAERLLSQVILIDGEGDSFAHTTTMAQLFETKVVVFLDGDKKQEAERLSKRYPKVPVVLLAERDFEELVPRTVYLASVAEVLSETLEREVDITEKTFAEWLANARPTTRERKAFTKQVMEWLEACFEVEPSKPMVMARCVDAVEPADVSTAGLLELLGHVRNALGLSEPTQAGG
jgi:hypothetical protein